MTAQYTPRSPKLEFGRHLREMARRWPIILALTLLAGFGVFAFRSLGSDTYESTTVLQIVLPDQLLDDGESTKFATSSLAELATAETSIVQAAQTIGLTLDPSEAIGRVKVQLRSTPGFMELSASGPTAIEAKGLTDAMAEFVVASGSNEASGLATRVVVPAKISDSPVAPRPIQEGLLAALIAAILAGELVVAVRKLRGKISPIDPETVLSELTRLPVVDLRPKRAQEAALVPFFATHLVERPVITLMQRGAKANAEPAERLARTASGLARRVLLIDADLAQPILHKHFGHPQAPGLAEVLEGSEALAKVVRRASDTNPAAVLSAGSLTADLVGVDRVMATHEVVSASGADCAVLSTTASSSLDEALLVAHHFNDAVVLAIDPGVMRETEILDLIDRTRGTGARLVGILLYASAVKSVTTQRLNGLRG